MMKWAWGVFGAVATIVGFLAAVLALAPLLAYDPANERFVDDGAAMLTLAEGGGVRRGVFVAKEIRIEGEVEAGDGLMLIADRIVFNRDARIKGPSSDVFLVSVTVSGATVDVSGLNGADLNGSASGVRGEPAGNVRVLAAAVGGLTVAANGGAGAEGAVGGQGADGRRGRCDGFGGYRGANPGGPGKPGGPGGDAGDGGRVEAIFPAATDVQQTISVEPGRPGGGGPGGAGGRGGAGCTGLGGSQPSRPNGPTGPVGPTGAPGEPGAVLVERVADFEPLGGAVRAAVAAHASGTNDPAALWAMIEEAAR